MKLMKKLWLTFLFAYVPSLLILTAMLGGNSDFVDTPFAFDLLILLLYSFPVFSGMMEAAVCVAGMLQTRGRGRIITGILLLIAMGAVMCAWMCVLIWRELIFLSWILTVIWLAAELIGMIRHRKKPCIRPVIRQFSFWGTVLAILLAVTLCAGVYRGFADAQRKPEPAGTFEITV